MRGSRRSSSTTPYSSPSSGKTSPRGLRIHSSLSFPRRRGWTSSSASSGPGSALRSHSTKRGRTGGAYESGTVYELETAAESYRARGTPDLVVYRRTSDPSLPLHDEAERQRRLAQLAALEAFIRRWFFHEDGSFKAAFHTFQTPDQFEQQLETHLRKLIREKVEKAEHPGGLGEGEIVFHGVPYPGLKVFGLEDAPVFYGRARRWRRSRSRSGRKPDETARSC